MIAHLIEERVTYGDSLLEATTFAFKRLEGLNAIIAMDAQSRELVATKQMSPLVAGLDGNGILTIASDHIALQGYAVTACITWRMTTSSASPPERGNISAVRSDATIG